MSPSLTYAVDAGRKVELNEINRDQQWEAEVKWREKVAGYPWGYRVWAFSCL
jgi:hypothetical protein